MVDNKPLIRRRASLKAKLTLFESHLTTVESCDRLSRLQLTELNDRLSKIEEIYSEFDSVQCDIENELEIPDEQYKEREAFESKYFGLVARARELLSATAPAPGASAGSVRSETGSCSSDPAAIPTLSRYMRIQQLKAHFWSRYYTEYITELQKRQKWRKQGQQLQLGEMVLVKDDRLPPNRWLLGRVTRLYPGSDGVTRVADVNTTSGTLRRAFNRLCPLPVMDTNFVPGAATC
ncbi:uncharacterized protein LOC134801301 [Cydia splendana]|uniref:uncharacterized protein LOC134801301 n=1 Tax=Cydia splendana TaxID=1100963 RepID=UPI00300D288F